MVPLIRESFNNAFTNEKYENYIKQINSKHTDAIEFRLAETPIFLDKLFTQKMLSTCESIVDVLLQPNFKALTKNAVPAALNVANESKHPDFIAFDFGICENNDGEIEPQLVEMQGFPSLFAYQVWCDEVIRKCFDIPANYSTYLNGLNKESYLQLLKEIITDGHPVENCILLEILPEQQKTRIDFYFTKEYTGIETVCLTELVKEGKQLFYWKEGSKIQVKRIYNRIIFDDLLHQTQEIQDKGKLFTEDLDVEWVPHPNWFYRISKYTLPFIKHRYVPETTFLDELTFIPEDLENFVLKPLFSFAGKGVVIDVTQEDINATVDKHNWILQRKVKYATIIKTPDDPAKAEIRLFYFWPKDAVRPFAVNNLARLSKGKMIGVRYNADEEWVGGSVAYFEL